MLTTIQSRAESYLTFTPVDEEFAAHVSDILNILKMQKITKVPKAPSYIKGFIDIREKSIPVIDTKLMMGLSLTEYTNAKYDLNKTNIN